jgi:surfactin synthase thioesterase subunit
MTGGVRSQRPSGPERHGQVAVTHDAPVPTASLIHFPASGEPRRRVFCFPFAGGAAATYRSWNRTLPEDVAVAFVQFPGRDPARQEDPLTSIDEMTAAAVQVIEDHADLPFTLFGHSMGAAIAYETTVELERRGGPRPDGLYVSARVAPDELPGAGPIHHLPDDEFIDAIGERFGGIPEVILNEPDLLAMFLPVLRADVQAYETYRQRTHHRVGCPVWVFGGSDDPSVTPERLTGWSRIAERPIEVEIFPGDHFYVNEHGSALTRCIAARWSAVETDDDGA